VTSERLLLHERALENGALEKVWLEADEGALFLYREGEGRAHVPIAFLDGIMARYGRELEDEVACDGPRLAVEGRTLSMLRYRPRYDVVAKDYFIYAKRDAPPVAELATAVTAALEYLLGRR
jgi:hypothetical protein